MISFRKKKNSRQKKNGRMTQETITNNNHTISTEICLEAMVPYEFAIYDSFGDVLCCYEGPGEYAVTVDSSTIKSGGPFKTSDIILFEFKACLNDLDCNYNDSSTTDRCNLVASTCAYKPLAGTKGLCFLCCWKLQSVHRR